MDEDIHKGLRKATDRYFDCLCQHIVNTHKALRELEASRFNAANPEQQAELYVLLLSSSLLLLLSLCGLVQPSPWNVTQLYATQRNATHTAMPRAKRSWIKCLRKRARWRTHWTARCQC